MKATHLLRLYLLVGMLVAVKSVAAQNSIYNPAVVWKKEVTREIEVRTPKKVTHSKGEPRDSSLAEMMTSAIFGGWIACYSDVDQTLTMRETADELYVILGLKPPSPGPNDYTGKRIADGSHSKFSYDSIYRYRLLEEWTYNPSTGATDIHIAGIAPIRNYYYDGEFIGKQAIFWMKYADASGILERYKNKYPGNSFYANIWNDYFSNKNDYFSNKPDDKGPVFRTTVTRIIDLANKEDSIIYRLKDVNIDSTLMTQVSVLLAKKKINIYDSVGAPLKKEDYWPIPDTTDVVDPITGQEMRKIVEYEPIIVSTHYVKVTEDWRFNTATGDIHIQATNIVPYRPKTIRDGNTFPARDIGWLRYDDIKDIIARHEQTHPTNNLATNIWNNYFYSDVKPAVLK